MAKEPKVEKKETKKKVVKKAAPKKEKKKKEPFFKGLKAEVSKIKWPESKEVIKYSVATLFMCIFIGLFFQLLEFLSSLIKGIM